MRLAERWCGNRADARDLLQDTYERAARQGVPCDLRSPRSWLVAIMHNLFVDRCRAVTRRPTLVPLDDAHGVRVTASDGGEPTWSRIGLDDIRAALAELAPVHREVFELHVLQAWPYERVAAHMAIRRITVGTRLCRARRKLRDVLARRFAQN